MLKPGYRVGKAEYLIDSGLSNDALAGFRAATEDAGQDYFDIPDMPGAFKEGVLWKSGQQDYGVLRIPVAEMDKVLNAAKQSVQYVDAAIG